MTSIDVSPYYRAYSFPRLSFWDGVISAFDLTGGYHNPTISTDPARTDAEAIRSDWETVGQDLYRAIEQYEAESLES